MSILCNYAIYLAIFIHMCVIFSLCSENSGVRVGFRGWGVYIMEIILFANLWSALFLSNKNIKNVRRYISFCAFSFLLFIAVILFFHVKFYSGLIIGEWDPMSLWSFHLCIIAMFLVIKVVFDFANAHNSGKDPE